ncbi:MAG: glycoside hydrolase family 38 C-terminal domain-containing protein [Pseudomonadota bacterium]
MSHRFRFTAEKIASRLQLICPLIHRRRHPIGPFRYKALPNAEAPPPLVEDFGDWPVIEPESYWGCWDQNFLLRVAFRLPDEWNAACTALHLPLGNAGDIFTHPEALAYIDGKPMASADRYHDTIEIPAHLADGREHELALHGWTGLSGWPPDPEDRTKLFMRPCAVVEIDRATRDFVALAETALDVAGHLDETRPEKHKILNALDNAFLALDTRDPLTETFYQSVPEALVKLQEGLAAAGEPMDIALHGIGHGHIDIAYLWSVAQGRRKAMRTSANVLRLMERFPDYCFSQSQAQLYRFIEEDDPDIFEAIRTRVAEGRWELMGGMWVEADTNIPSGESLVRQLLLGRRYFQERFGDRETPVLWLPDCFGFSWCLPQLMKQAGLRWFITNKVNWNQYNPMPASTTWWQGIDGTRVLTHILTTPRDVQYLPFPTCYKSDLTAKEVFGTWETARPKDHVRALPICYGYGDGGGGPTDAMLRKAEALTSLPGAPRFRMSTVRAFFEDLEETAPPLPVWSDEIYLEGHRGVLTSQGRIKRLNREAERALHEAELLAACAQTMGAYEPLMASMTKAWECLCLNQFHDILPGTAISEVFDQAEKDYAEIADITRHEVTGALTAIADKLDMAASFVAINPSPFPGRRIGLLPRETGPLHDLESSRDLVLQPVTDGVLVALDDMPAHGLLALGEGGGQGQAAPLGSLIAELSNDGALLENDLIRVEFDGDGRLTRFYDKAVGRDVLQPGEHGNQLQVFEDRPLCWDAWDIDAFFEDRPDVVGGVERIDVIETGPLRATLLIERRYRSSKIVQEISLFEGSKRLDFATDVDWHETHILLKVAFPVDILAPSATYEIQWGSIERPTHASTTHDAARFEVPAQKWVDLSETGYGVALMNDCKHGYDVRGGVLRLSLIKSATMPDDKADQGQHCFTYSLLPHVGDWRDVVPSEAYALNQPLRIEPISSGRGSVSKLAFLSVDQRHAIIETIKPAEDGNGFILRLYEATGRRGPITLRFGVPIKAVLRADLMETNGDALPVIDDMVTLSLQPFEIVTLRCLPA